MSTKLDELLTLVDPEVIFENIYRRADEAINTFDLRVSQIDKWDKFRDCVTNFMEHLDSQILSLQKKLDAYPEVYWSRGAHSLIKIYGINGEKAAFEMSRTGNEHGLYGVLKALAMQVAEDYADKEISARVGYYWYRLSAQEKMDASTEYMAKFGHLFPSELTEGSAARVRANLPKFLEKHPDSIQKMRRIGRSPVPSKNSGTTSETDSL